MLTDRARIEAALATLPPDLPREDWARVAMALKAELGEAGLDLFDSWSKPGRSYDPAAVRSTWRSVKAEGGVRIGTLFAMARSFGWQPPPDPAKRKRSATDAAPAGRGQVKPPPLTSAPADPAADRAAAEEKAAKQAAAAKAARGLWDSAPPAGDAHPYLTRHKAAAGPLRQSGGDLLAPMFDAGGELWNVQRIRRDGQKRFAPGGRVSGLLCPVRPISAGSSTVVLCEGVATALAIAAALPAGVAVFAAFSAGNLAAAARAVRSAWPALPIVAAGDDDAAKHPDGRNPGRDAATKAAAEVGGVAVLPAPLAAEETDFADLAMRAPAAVASVLAVAVERACAARAVSLAPRPAAAGASPAGDALAIFDEPGRDGDPFRLTREGVFWLRPRNGEPGVFDTVKLAAPLKIEARSRDESGHGWGYLLAFVDAAGHLRRWVMPARLTSGDGAELRARLLDDGLWIAPGQAARGNLLDT